MLPVKMAGKVRPIESWESQLRGFPSGPPPIGRRLVASGPSATSAGSVQAARVYAMLGYGQPVTALDPTTGKTRYVFAGTEGVRELLCRHGVR